MVRGSPKRYAASLLQKGLIPRRRSFMAAFQFLISLSKLLSSTWYQCLIVLCERSQSCSPRVCRHLKINPSFKIHLWHQRPLGVFLEHPSSSKQGQALFLLFPMASWGELEHSSCMCKAAKYSTMYFLFSLKSSLRVRIPPYSSLEPKHLTWSWGS